MQRLSFGLILPTIIVFIEQMGNNSSSSTFSVCVSLHRKDVYAKNSIDMLIHAGIQFERHQEQGINAMDFGELLMSSGLVLLDEVKWLSFHRSIIHLLWNLKMYKSCGVSESYSNASV